MCLYNQLMPNPKYKANKKNGGDIPSVPDTRVLWVPIGCGKCIECRKAKSRDWQLRLTAEIEHTQNNHFYTLTFSNDAYEKLTLQVEGEGYVKENNIAIKGVRYFLELYRKHHGKSPRHWLITELGQTNTERIHLHGIIQTKLSHDELAKLWKHGYSSRGKYCNEATANYITKYLTKVDVLHQQYKPVVLASAGIGKQYLTTTIKNELRYNENKTREYYLTKSGHRLPLPIYYRNKIYTDHEREQLWIKKLDEGYRYVLGQKYKNGSRDYFKAVEKAQRQNIRMGYEAKLSYQEEEYRRQLRVMNYLQKIRAK